MADPPTPLSRLDLDDVEATRALAGSRARQPERGGPHEAVPLEAGDGVGGRRDPTGGARLHLDEDDRSSVEGDDVDLAVARPEPSGNDVEAALREPAAGGVFPRRAEGARRAQGGGPAGGERRCRWMPPASWMLLRISSRN